tara:strand:+ start:1921 stop:2061 length:141 start_codon:yes stop_codon:yes gene_type:complete
MRYLKALVPKVLKFDESNVIQVLRGREAREEEVSSKKKKKKGRRQR